MSQPQTRCAAQAQESQLKRHYEYKTLPGGRTVRYLILHPARIDTDPIACTMRAVHLDEIPDFEAISYVWGVPVENQPIACNGGVICITASLRDALRQIRLPDKPRTLWVDSICINQVDRQEQGHQVSLMGEIYSKSSCTLICLGRSDHTHARIVADLVADIDTMIQLVFERADFSWGPNSFPFPEKEDPLLLHRGWTSFGVLLQQPWFRRGWVVQEAALGQDARLLWADTEIDWFNLVRAYVWYTRRALNLPDIRKLWLSDLHIQGFYIRRSREAITFRPENTTGPISFLEVLEHARFLGVTDPRDRIYAFLSLPSSSKQLPAIRPNYEVSCLHLYRSFACEYLRASSDLDILHFVHNDNNTLEGDTASWIPRWDTHLYSSYTGTLNNYISWARRIVSQSWPQRITVSPAQTTLKLQAILIDNVGFAARSFDKYSTTTSDVASLWKSLSTRPKSSPYTCSSLVALITVLRCGVYRGRLAEWKMLESAYMQLLQHELYQDNAQHTNADLFHGKRMEDVHNKSFILLSRGYYGLAPGIVREGDVCCIIFGTRSPFIIRKIDQAGCYKLVGSALILSKELDSNGYPGNLGGGDDCQDWLEWGLKEEEICLH